MNAIQYKVEHCDRTQLKKFVYNLVATDMLESNNSCNISFEEVSDYIDEKFDCCSGFDDTYNDKFVERALNGIAAVDRLSKTSAARYFNLNTIQKIYNAITDSSGHVMFLETHTTELFKSAVNNKSRFDSKFTIKEIIAEVKYLYKTILTGKIFAQHGDMMAVLLSVYYLKCKNISTLYLDYNQIQYIKRLYQSQKYDSRINGYINDVLNTLLNIKL